MSRVVVDVHNRCNRICNCNGGRHLTVSTGPVLNTNFRYCTHEAKGNTKISNVTWQGIEVEKIGGLAKAFQDTKSVTVYYHKTYDGQQASVKKPLLVRVKNSDKTYWFENLGHHVNKKWQRINDEAESGNYPNEDNYSYNARFEAKLEAIACRLFVSHSIQTDYDRAKNHGCPICNQPVNVRVEKENPLGIIGYIKYEFIGTFSDKSILAYKGNQITYRRKQIGSSGYYLPIQLDTNIEKVVLYYWNGDDSRKNPLLIELVGTFGFSYWFENIGQPGGKHDKWKPIGHMESKGFSQYEKLKSRLDILNCIYNGVVQINVGEKKICHESKHYLHKNRIHYGYSEAIGTDPVLYAYRYGPSLSSGEMPFNISEVIVNGLPQSFKDKSLPFSITNFTAYVSPCDEDKPFLISVETITSVRSKIGKNYAWYYRETNGNDWKLYSGFHNNQSPDDIIHRLKGVLENAKKILGLKDCHKETGVHGIQLNIKETPGPEQSFIQYYDKSTTGRKIPIFVTKASDTPVPGFFRNSHKPATTKKTFVVQQQLVDGSNFQNKQRGLENVYAYFWEGNLSDPILLGVKKSGGSPTFYAKAAGQNKTWMYSWVQGLDETEALDHQNCYNNNAIPVDLRDPTNIEQFKSPIKQFSCLKDDLVTLLPLGSDFPKGATNVYEAKAYKIDDGKRVSRVIHGKNPTNIVPPYTQYGPTLNIYLWKKEPDVPLIVEFKPKDGGQSTWYENLGKAPNYQEWKRIHESISKEFYNSPQKKLTEKFTIKLNKVNCRVHGVVQIDISRKTKEPYCHTSIYAHTKRIKVTPESKSAYPGFIGYEHTPVDQNTTLTVSSFYNRYDKQEVDGKGIKLPLENVKNVTVYFPVCDGGVTAAIKIEHKQGKGDREEAKWLKREENNKWKEATTEFEGKSLEQIGNLLENIKTTTSACNRTSKVSAMPDSGSGVQTSPLDQDDKKLTLNDIFSEVASNPETERATSDTPLEQDDEYEHEEIKETQNEIMFVGRTSTPPISVTPSTGSMNPHLAYTTPSITIDIRRCPNNGNAETYKIPAGSGPEVFLRKYEYPYDSGFHMFIHEASAGQPFTVKEVKYGDDGKDHRADIGIGDEELEYLAVWYWQYSNMTNPLLTEVKRSDGKFLYRSNKGGGSISWTTVDGKNHNGDPTQLQDETLEKKLDGLNCQLNQAVTMDLSHSKSQGQVYCCDRCSRNRISVSSYSITIISNSNVGGSLASIPYYKHELLDGSNAQLAKIKYYLRTDNSKQNKKRVKSTTLKFPIKGPVTVYVFYCQENPSLIYIKHGDYNKWFKRKRIDDYDGDWIEAGLNSLTPDKIKSSDCDHWKKLKSVLNGLGCSMDTCNITLGTSTITTTTSVTSESSSLPEIVIDLSYKPKSDNTPQPYNDGSNLKVTRHSYPPNGSTQDFFRYEHTLDHNRNFTLKGIVDDQGGKMNVISVPVEKVTSVHAYYWKDDKSGSGLPTKALLVEVVESGSKYSYYAKIKDQWEKYDHIEKDGKPSQAELDLLNCDINDVVQIDVTNTYSYCHNGNGHVPTKVKVNNLDTLGNYKALEHKPNGGTIFNISGFTEGSKNVKLGTVVLPIMNSKRVVVYFCKNGAVPLLVYLSNANSGNQWFQKSNNINTWELVNQLNEKNDSDNSAIIDFLDSLKTICTPPMVTINLYKRDPTRKKETYKEETSHKTINVKKISHSCGSTNLTEYQHTVNGRKSYFTVEQFQYDGKPTQGRLGQTDKVTSVSVFYWTPLETEKHKERNRPLLVKVSKQDNVSLYYENRDYQGSNRNDYWSLWRLGNIPPDNLEAKLLLLNCRLNNALIVDVSKFGTKTDYYDACDSSAKQLDYSHGERIQVTKDIPSDQSLGNYEVYTHKLRTPSDGKVFHIVGFKNDKTPITEIGSLPILGVKEVKVYRCDTDNNSLLIYINTDNSAVQQKLYKNGKPKTQTGEWTSTAHDLLNADPNKHEDILGVLNSLDSSCKSAVKDPHAEKSVAGGIATGLGYGIYGVISGPLAGAGGLTGFGWWAFKRSKGDPWVRQI